jgi:formylmethanofuran dehydrogenase subunit E
LQSTTVNRSKKNDELEWGFSYNLGKILKSKLNEIKAMIIIEDKVNAITQKREKRFKCTLCGDEYRMENIDFSNERGKLLCKKCLNSELETIDL